MKIRLSRHLKQRLIDRKIEFSIPKEIVKDNEKIYYDTETKYWIAVKNKEYGGKTRPMVAIFERKEEEIVIITVYPTNTKEINSRLEKGRWKYEEVKN